MLVFGLIMLGAFIFGAGCEKVKPDAGEKPLAQKSCVVGGCSGHICEEEGEGDGLITTCEWQPEYACYIDSFCERQKDRKCGWTKTP